MNHFETIITDDGMLAKYDAAADRMRLSPARTAEIKRENAERLSWWLSQPIEKRVAFLEFFGETS